jgi:hypothetical protein
VRTRRLEEINGRGCAADSPGNPRFSSNQDFFVPFFSTRGGVYREGRKVDDEKQHEWSVSLSEKEGRKKKGHLSVRSLPSFRATRLSQEYDLRRDLSERARDRGALSLVFMQIWL